MLSLQSPEILSIYASQRAAQLRQASRSPRDVSPTDLRRWVGEQLVRIGAWVMPKPTIAHAPEAA